MPKLRVWARGERCIGYNMDFKQYITVCTPGCKLLSRFLLQLNDDGPMETHHKLKYDAYLQLGTPRLKIGFHNKVSDKHFINYLSYKCIVARCLKTLSISVMS